MEVCIKENMQEDIWMRVLYVIPEYLPDFGGGIITFYKALVPAMRELGVQVDVLVASGSRIGQPEQNIDGIRVMTIPIESHAWALASMGRMRELLPKMHEYFSIAWAAWHCMKGGEDYDLIETTDWPVLFIPWVLNQGIKPVVVQMHGSYGQITDRQPSPGTRFEDDLFRLVELNLLKCAVGITTYSRLNADEWGKRLGRPISYIPAPYDCSIRVGNPVNRVAGEMNATVFARLCGWKGAFQMAEDMKKLDKPLCVNWYGRDIPTDDANTSSYAKCQSILKSGNAKACILNHKPVCPQTRDQLMLESSFVLIPSLWDMFNFTVIEAMSLGAIVLCSKGAGASEWVEDGVSGFVYNPGEVNSFNSVIERISSLNDAQRKSIGEEARGVVAEKLDIKITTKSRLQFYQQAYSAGKPCCEVSDWIKQLLNPDAVVCTNRKQILSRFGIRELLESAFLQIRNKMRSDK